MSISLIAPGRFIINITILELEETVVRFSDWYLREYVSTTKIRILVLLIV